MTEKPNDSDARMSRLGSKGSDPMMSSAVQLPSEVNMLGAKMLEMRRGNERDAMMVGKVTVETNAEMMDKSQARLIAECKY